MYLENGETCSCCVACSGDEAERLDSCARGQLDQAHATAGDAGSSQFSQSSMRSKELEGLSGDSDVLAVPKFVDVEGASSRLADGNLHTMSGQVGIAGDFRGPTMITTHQS